MVKCKRHKECLFYFTNMEKRTKMAKSVKKFIRNQKAQIRRQFFDVKKQEEAIKEMYLKLNNKK